MTANYMYPPVVVNIDQPNPPCFFICQKVIISVLNTISALFVGFLALVCLFGIIFGSSKVVVSELYRERIASVVSLITFLTFFPNSLNSVHRSPPRLPPHLRPLVLRNLRRRTRGRARLSGVPRPQRSRHLALHCWRVLLRSKEQRKQKRKMVL